MAHAIPKLIAVAVVRSGEHYLAGPRPPGVPLAGQWEFPGGKVEPLESAAAAAVRECHEETGLDVRVVGEYPSVDIEYPHGALRLRFFACELAAEPDLPTGLPKPSQPFEWVARSRLATLPFPPANTALVNSLVNPLVNPLVNSPVDSPVNSFLNTLVSESVAGQPVVDGLGSPAAPPDVLPFSAPPFLPPCSALHETSAVATVAVATVAAATVAAATAAAAPKAIATDSDATAVETPRSSVR